MESNVQRPSLRGVHSKHSAVVMSMAVEALGSSELGSGDDDMVCSIGKPIAARKSGLTRCGVRRTRRKHFGKRIKRYYYLPLLDDANINDQGIDANGVAIADGNLYGSSKDMGSIPAKLPTLTEHGGRVNRVGFKRREIEGTFQKFGFFYEYTQESLDFDTDSELMMHMTRETLRGANEIVEDMLQMDLINNAGMVKYTGTAASIAEVDDTPLTYRDLLRLHIDLNQNRTPMKTEYFKGTRMIDTVTIPGARVLYIGSELQPLFEEMVDLHGERAFIPVQKYAGGGTIMNGEIGACCYFRIVVVPEQLHMAGAGADSTGNTTHYTTGANYDIFPLICIGSESFTTIGFQTDGKTAKFKIYHKKPGKEMVSREDPFGETGLASLKFYYGFMGLRTERLAVIWSSAAM